MHKCREVSVPAELQETANAEIEAALRTLYEVCEKYNLPMAATVINTQFQNADGDWRTGTSSSRYAAGDCIATTIQAYVSEGLYTRAMQLLAEIVVQEALDDGAEKPVCH
ncbi:hypothetical protein NEN25_25150 [Escherichia coli]|nr:hypothetical protein [Escherichia coli]MEB7197140.1 hypothetical protein [Escherichia coli]MEB7207086.1 hypothetical protein [Escherichia coli]MEB7231492.1 hypothetical protein [Escherichia coli]